MTLRGMLLWMKRLLGGAQSEPPATTSEAPSESVPAEDDAPALESTPEPELDTDSRESIEATMRAQLATEDADAVIEALARTVHLDLEATDTIELGRSRLGGAPDLAPGLDWPSWPIVPYKAKASAQAPVALARPRWCGLLTPMIENTL